MNLYVESSAVVAWLFGEPSAVAVEPVLAKAEMVLTSDLTLVECDRALVRAEVSGGLPRPEADRRRAVLEEAASQWTFLRLDEDVVERARRRFPGEPLRSLDALHLATVLTARFAVPGLALLSLDGRVRGSAQELGLRVLPD
ncbi:MAG TPA: type II toxin-antitoxin system VapC family toxin [Thermoanaerobaculia bacterium]|nr:type II toxin-antitoxin system VapC family toxin [Thermoanaerobaculia bacterium]